RVGLLRRVGRGAEAVAREVPCAELRRARGDRDVHDRRCGRRPDRDRRLAGRRDGRGRSVTTETALYDQIQEIRARYPDSLSAVMPALQLAQVEHGGWLPPEAFREVADALDLTPAYCLSIASFYDMFR